MAKVVRHQHDKTHEQPKYLLKAYAFDYFVLYNVKLIEKEHGINLTKSENVPINFNVQAQIGFADEERVIQIQVNMIIQTQQKDRMLPLAEMIIAFDYQIENYTQFKNNDFPQPFLSFLCNVSIGTCRGLLSAKLSNTYLQNLIMPIILQQSPLIDVRETTSGNPLAI